MTSLLFVPVYDQDISVQYFLQVVERFNEISVQ
jgi:hypothetical protein